MSSERPAYKRGRSSAYTTPPKPAQRPRTQPSQPMTPLTTPTMHGLHIVEARNEFPFPIIPPPLSLTKHLARNHLTHDPDMDVTPVSAPLATPPRSHPSLPKTPLSINTNLASSYSSPRPSLSTTNTSSTVSSALWSPYAPMTPITPASLFSSAAHTLQQVMMADELGLSVDEVKEIDDFASMDVSGCRKRSGRVLARKYLAQRRTSARKGNTGIERTEKARTLEHGRDWWKQVNWSAFSDSDSDSSDEEDEDNDWEYCGNTAVSPLSGSNCDLSVSFPQKVGTRSCRDFVADKRGCRWLSQ